MSVKRPGSGWGVVIAAAAAAVGGLVVKKLADDRADARAREGVARQREAEREREGEQRQRVHDAVTSAVLRLANAFDVPLPPMVLDERVPNAASDGKQILVNPTWFRRLLGVLCDDPICDTAVAHGVLGHEMAHHVHGDALVPAWIRDSHNQELRADFYAGRALALFGDDIATMEAVLSIFATTAATATHPAHADRVRSMREGFDYQNRRGVRRT